MAGTFLGKWTIYVSTIIPSVLNGHASYEDPTFGSQMGNFCVWYDNPPSGSLQPHKNNQNIAFVLRDDGQLCFLLNNGQYVAYLDRYFVWENFPLESAAAFTFPGQDTHQLQTIFSSWIKYNDQFVMAAGFPTNVFVPTSEEPDKEFGYSMYLMWQVTPPPSVIKASGKGDGLDFAWVDLTNVDLSNCSLTGADFSNCNLSGVNFSSANLNGANLAGATFNGTILDGATLVGAVFSEGDTHDDLTNVVVPRTLPKFYTTTPPSPTNPLTSLAGCRLNQSLLGNDWSMLDLSDATILNLNAPLSTGTNQLLAHYSILTGLNGNNFSSLSLVSVDFKNAVLDKLDLSKSDMTNANLTQASLHEANLDHAILEGALMNGSQLGSLAQLFTLDLGLKGDLNAGNVSSLRDVFSQNAKTLSASATITTLDGTRGVWQLNDAGNNVIYTIQLANLVDGTQVLTVYSPATAASLTATYMPDAVLSGANLFGVIASSAHFYGTAAVIDQFAIIEEAHFDDANLSNLNLSNAQLFGADLSGAHLFNANFNAAKLTPSAIGTLANLSRANLQGADFSDARLDGADLTDAAIATATPTKGNANQGGVYLFSLPYQGDRITLTQYTLELDAAATKFSLNPTGDATTLARYVTALTGKDLNTLKAPFALHHPPIILSPASQITTIVDGSVWQIVDGAASYSLWTDIDDNGSEELYAAPALTNIQAAFQENRFPLRWQASAAVDQTEVQWLLDNDSQNPQNSTIGYMKFLLILNAGGLDVFGISVRITRLGDNNQSIFDSESCSVTKLGTTNMSGETKCPNGTTLKVNQEQNGVSWDDKWLRANSPPAPPSCVPTDNGYCAPPGKQ